MLSVEHGGDTTADHHHFIMHHHNKEHVISYGMQVLIPRPRLDVLSEVKGSSKGVVNLGFHLNQHKVPHHSWREIRPSKQTAVGTAASI